MKRLNNFREPIPEAYFPKMDSLVSSRAWQARHANMVMSDLNRELDQIRNDISDLERWDARFVQACHQGYVQDVKHIYFLYLAYYFMHSIYHFSRLAIAFS